MMTAIKEITKGLARRVLSRVAHDYSAGVDVESGLKVGGLLEARGYEITLGYWNEEGEDPVGVTDKYMHALDGLSTHPTRGYLSMKANAFGYDKQSLSRLMDSSRQRGVPLHFDSMWPEAVDQTFELVCSLKASNPIDIVGITLPGRWRRSLEDVDFTKQLNLPVRVVKGQWEDSLQPEPDMREGFLSIVKRLSNHSSCVRIATHDIRLARQSLLILQENNVNCELELLYGLPVCQSLKMAEKLKVRVRIYVPFGKAWVPYCLSFLRKEPRRFLWLLKDLTSKPYLSKFPESPASP